MGDLFERGEVFLPGLIVASEAMTAAVEILEAALPDKRDTRRTLSWNPIHKGMPKFPERLFSIGSVPRQIVYPATRNTSNKPTIAHPPTR